MKPRKICGAFSFSSTRYLKTIRCSIMVDILFYTILILLIAEFVLLAGESIMGGFRRPNHIIHVPVPYEDFPHEEGHLELAHGRQEIFVPTKQAPARVWLCFEAFEGVQCCLGNVDMFTTYCTTEGFVILANINSENAYVKWTAEFV